MAAQNLLNIIGNDEAKTKLLMLIERQNLLNGSQEVFKQEKLAILEEVKQLGLKPAEFSKIVKYSHAENQELLFNELTTLKAINDHLLG